MIRLSTPADTLPETRPPMAPNSLRGEFTVPLGGCPVAFDTTLGSVARLEEHCGGRTILEVVNAVVTGRRATDQIALLGGALRAAGHTPAEADALAARATVPEAEAFVLALMGALGFTLTPRPTEERDPLGEAPVGGTGAPSRSAA